MKEIIQKYKEQFKEVISDLKTPGKRHKQIPNILTASRLLAPFLIIPSVALGNFAIAGISTLLFSATDMVDGILARKLKLTSELGKDLDAFADKIFVATLISSLLFTNLAYLVPLVLEASISGINIYKKINNKNPESHMIGKVKMTSLYFLIATGFMNMYFKVPSILINTLYASTIGLQILTIHDYSKANNNTDKKEEISEINKNIEDSIKEDDNIPAKEKSLAHKYLQKYRFYKELLEEQKRYEEQKKEKGKVNVKKDDKRK